ncbi:MAG: TatD family hydrolase [Chitinophagales bacterium]
MEFIDTHSHLYLENFKNDLEEVISNCKTNNVNKVLLPNIDVKSIEQIKNLVALDNNMFYAMMGLHPTSVDENYKESLDTILENDNLTDICAIGEIGLDYYWSTEFKEQQIEAFQFQIDFAKKRKLPIAIHCRNAFDDILNILEKNFDENLKGVLHCFTGNEEQAKRLIDMNFYLGLGGVLTYKNSGLNKVIEKIDLKHLILETDAPYLSPTPFRGKRNESSYTIYVAEKLAQIKEKSLAEVASQTTLNAKQLFNI